MAKIKYKYALCSALAAVLFSAFALPACTSRPQRIKISVGMWRGTSAQEHEYYNECKTAFESRYPQYEVVASPYVYDQDTIVAKFASGQLPTLFEADAYAANAALKDGYVADVSRYMDEFNWSGKADGFFLSQITSDSGVSGVPASQTAAGMVLNIELLERAGVIERSGGEYVLYDGDGNPLYPDTFDEVAEVARKVRQVFGEDSYGILLPSGSRACGEIYLGLAYNYGCGDLEREDADGNLSLTLDLETFGGAMRWVRQLSQEGLTDDSRAYDIKDWAEEMAGGRVAMALSSGEDLAVALAEQPSLRGNVAFVPLPSQQQGVSVWQGTVYAISGLASQEQAEGAMLLLQFMGCGPELEGSALDLTQSRLKADAERGVPYIESLPVWDDEEYIETLNEVCGEYAADGIYTQPFCLDFAERRRAAEPVAYGPLCRLTDELFSKMLFAATTTNIVTLLEESASAFTAEYLNK